MLESLVLFYPLSHDLVTSTSFRSTSIGTSDIESQILVALDILWELSMDVDVSESTRRFLIDSRLVKPTRGRGEGGFVGECRLLHVPMY